MTMPTMPAPSTRAVPPHSELIPPRRVLLLFLPAITVVAAAILFALRREAAQGFDGPVSALLGFTTGLVLSSTTMLLLFYSFQRRVVGGAARSASMRLIASLDLERTAALIEGALASERPRRPDARTFQFAAPRARMNPIARLRMLGRVLRGLGAQELAPDGEKIEISLEPDGSDTAISVRSRSRVPLVVFDLGKNLQTVQRLGERISSHLAQALSLERQQLDAARARHQITEAQLGRLQAQHEAHFLFNTLAHVRLLVDESPRRAGEMLDALIPYLRSVSGNLASEETTLGQELEAVRGYLAVMSLRLGERLRSEVICPEGALRRPLLAAALLPLVENAIKHGVEVSRAGGLVRISVREEASRLLLEVLDTGPGFTRETGAGSGLANLRARLAARYGAAASLSLRQNQPSGLVATLTLPA